MEIGSNIELGKGTRLRPARIDGDTRAVPLPLEVKHFRGKFD
jgi:hypothetical protein